MRLDGLPQALVVLFVLAVKGIVHEVRIGQGLVACRVNVVSIAGLFVDKDIIVPAGGVVPVLGETCRHLGLSLCERSDGDRGGWWLQNRGILANNKLQLAKAKREQATAKRQQAI